MRALLLGATGLIGKETLAQLRGDTRFEKVIVLARRPGESDDQIEWRTSDFDAASTWQRLASDGLDAVFCCLGTTMKQAGSKDAFRRVDYEYPMHAAEALSARASRVRFALVSSVGADAGSSTFYLRTKGELERDLAKLGFDGLEVFQPSLLLGARDGTRGAEAFASAVMRPLSVLMRGPLKKFHAIEGKTVASALIASVTRPAKAPVSVYLFDDISKLAGPSQ